MAKEGPGRPPIEIDWDQFHQLCELQCTLSEFASWFNCSEDTIENKVVERFGMNFSEYFRKKRGKGKIALRRKQMQSALAGDKTMLIWLGKQYLGQSEKQDVTTTERKVTLSYALDKKPEDE